MRIDSASSPSWLQTAQENPQKTALIATGLVALGVFHYFATRPPVLHAGACKAMNIPRNSRGTLECDGETFTYHHKVFIPILGWIKTGDQAHQFM